MESSARNRWPGHFKVAMKGYESQYSRADVSGLRAPSITANSLNSYRWYASHAQLRANAQDSIRIRPCFCCMKLRLPKLALRQSRALLQHLHPSGRQARCNHQRHFWALRRQTPRNSHHQLPLLKTCHKRLLTRYDPNLRGLTHPERLHRHLLACHSWRLSGGHPDSSWWKRQRLYFKTQVKKKRYVNLLPFWAPILVIFIELTGLSTTLWMTRAAEGSQEHWNRSVSGSLTWKKGGGAGHINHEQLRLVARPFLPMSLARNT